MEKNEFNYSYSAPTEEEREEIEQIKRRYMPRTELEQKLGRMRALDKKVRLPARAVGWTLGVCGTLVFGFGLTLTLHWEQYLWGTFVAVFGGIMIGASFILHRILYRRAHDKYAKEILSLGDELTGKNE